MRDLALLIVIALLALKGMRAPWVAVLGWTWVSMMNPHGLSYRLNNAPVALVFALSALIGLLASRDRKEFVVSRETVVLMLFMAWMCITLPFSIVFDDSFELWKRVMKIDVMLLVTMAVLYSRKHLLAFVWVVAGSLAFYGIKGGLFTLATGGSYRVNGPEGGYITGNNEVGLALVMTIPLLRFLQTTVAAKWKRHALTGAMLLCGISVLGTQSRGAFLAVSAMLVVMWWRSDKRMLGLLLLPALAVAALSFMPETWWSRMDTIKTYQQDDSALGRLNAWAMAWNLATHNFFGGGFSVTWPQIFLMYAPEPDRMHAAHSIYFMVLGEHGFIGLFLFLLLFVLTFMSAGRLRTQARLRPETSWLSSLGAMCQVSLIGYAVGGAFLSLSYYDLPYNIMALVVMGCRWMDNRLWLTDADAGPRQPQMDLARTPT